MHAHERQRARRRGVIRRQMRLRPDAAQHAFLERDVEHAHAVLTALAPLRELVAGLARAAHGLEPQPRRQHDFETEHARAFHLVIHHARQPQRFGGEEKMIPQTHLEQRRHRLGAHREREARFQKAIRTHQFRRGKRAAAAELRGVDALQRRRAIDEQTQLIAAAHGDHAALALHVGGVRHLELQRGGQRGQRLFRLDA